MKREVLFRNRAVFLGDMLLIAVCVPASFVLRLNFGARLADFKLQILTMVLLAWIIKPLVYYKFGLYRRMWAYASIAELKLIIVAVTFASAIMFGVISIIQLLQVFNEFSRGAVLIDYVLSLVAVGGLRFSLRLIAENQTTSPMSQGKSRRVLIVGAGDAGALVVREMQKNPQANLVPVAFLDDDPAKQKQEIHGIGVVGILKVLPHIVELFHIDEVIIAIPSAPGQVVRMVADLCHQVGVPFRTMPGIHELIGGKVSVSRLREVEIADLLRRQPAQIDDELVGINLTNRRVLITGAGGSIGRELSRQIARWMPDELILLGHGENSLFETIIELEENYPSLPTHIAIADIRNKGRLKSIFEDYHPNVVFHTAAHKHVPLMENNIEEAITNNILGTRNVVDISLSNDVDRLVLISTDKAVRPSSVMGATKRLAEMIVVDAALRSNKAFSVVRFGNVLGSRGSIVPLFKRQIARGGPITITHPDMERYFMTIPEAVHLVLQAFAMGKGGETFILNMGEQVRILDLAEDLIRLSGLEPGKDIDIVFTGIRAGEKLSESLWDEGAAYQPTTHPDIFSLAEMDRLSGSDLENAIDQLESLAEQGNVESIVQAFDEFIPGAAVRSGPPPDITSIL
jgi:FlaA1/EpsC-like NDP-sugar epimerase